MNQKFRSLIWYLPPAIVIVAFLASFPWLWELDRSVARSLRCVAALSIMVWSVIAARRVDRRLDEVQQAGQRFAMRYGTTAGTMTFALLLMLPPFRNLATDFVIAYGHPGPGMTVDRSVVTFAMMLGFVGVSLLQMTSSLLMEAVWWKTRQ